MLRTESKTKSVRKPLRDLTNKGSTKTLSKSEIPKNKIIPKDSNNRNHNSLDCLLFLHSNLSSLLRQPWVPRFQKALSNPSTGEHENHQPGKNLEAEIVPFVDANENECFDVGSPEETTLDSLISPSPLVSWRVADCNVERGRQLFLLTPLPPSKAMSSKRCESFKSVIEGIASKSNIELASFLNIPGDENADLLDGVEMKATPVKPSGSVVVETDNTLECRIVSSPVFSKRDLSVFVTTPCLKMSPPKSCVLLEPILKSWNRGCFLVRKSTPYPVGINKSGFSESSGSEESPEDLSLKYPELRGIQQTYVPEIRKKELESSPTWLFSPPKSCILLEPPDEEPLDNVGTGHHLTTTGALNRQADVVFLKGNACQETMTINQVNAGISLAAVEGTPMWKEPHSTMRRGKHPGESTLKKELWSKFEAVSTYSLRYNTSAVQRTAKKGFLDMLDEVSCDEESSISDGLR
ncbi:2-oxoglutarate (2OG) and Fe(II)-dependent oxygenase superfamily protein [Hibiscus syriacus]|uniref:2-oxoglutarate (2OG) and Fe(II)-dependent oxygenase superfamily protein n=1 Tax=Hibiscus syriacus TaxID=106335 RepID=A0A6A2XEE9_HIBSY|nr:2-oxoglutarate (2OG) and Fe(II)-dependent oxygenase superfamily protein [Hibiscus syriacus]